MEAVPDAQPQEQQAISKKQMTDFFQRLRKNAGLTAVMDFSCCSVCGMLDVDDVRKWSTDIGYVFYNGQSALKIQDSGEVKLSYGGYPELGEFGPTTQQIGQIVAGEAERLGIPFEWTGAGNHPIKLISLDKEDFIKRFEVVPGIPRDLFGERTAVVRTEDGREFPYSFVPEMQITHKCANGRLPCEGGPCLHLPAAVAAGMFAPKH